MTELDERLAGIIGDLVETLQLREASEPDSPGWEADARVRRLEAELVERYRVIARAPSGASIDVAMAGVF